MAKTPGGQSCWLVPVINDRYAVIPSDDPKQECIPLWEETGNIMTGKLEYDKVVINRDVHTFLEAVIYSHTCSFRDFVGGEFSDIGQKIV